MDRWAVTDGSYIILPLFMFNLFADMRVQIRTRVQGDVWQVEIYILTGLAALLRLESCTESREGSRVHACGFAYFGGIKRVNEVEVTWNASAKRI